MSVWNSIVGQAQVVEQLKAIASGDPKAIDFPRALNRKGEVLRSYNKGRLIASAEPARREIHF